MCLRFYFFFFFQAEDGIRDLIVTGVQTCALPISAEHILQMPSTSCQVVPGQLHTRLRWVLREVHDNYVTHLILTPAPCHQVQVATVVGPTCTLAQLPFTPTQSRILDRCQQFLVERP